MKIFHTKKEVLMSDAIGQATLQMLQFVQPLAHALVSLDNYSITYPDSDDGTVTLQMNYEEMMSLYQAVKMLKEAGQLYFFDASKVKYVM